MTVKLLPRPTSINPDDNVGKGMDLAITVGLFLGLGYLVDRWLDTRPVFMIVLTLVAAVGKVIGMYYAYQLRMRALEHDRSAARYAGPRSELRPAEEPDDGHDGIRPEQFS